MRQRYPHARTCQQPCEASHYSVSIACWDARPLPPQVELVDCERNSEEEEEEEEEEAK